MLSLGPNNLPEICLPFPNLPETCSLFPTFQERARVSQPSRNMLAFSNLSRNLLAFSNLPETCSPFQTLSRSTFPEPPTLSTHTLRPTHTKSTHTYVVLEVTADHLVLVIFVIRVWIFHRRIPNREPVSQTPEQHHKRTWGICTRRAGKLYKARSRLYRSQFLQVNTRWKALAEIYTMHSFAQL